MAVDAIIVIKDESTIVTAKPHYTYYPESDTTSEMLEKIGYKGVIVEFPKRGYKVLKNRVRFMYSPESIDASVASGVIREFVRKWDGKVESHKWFVSGEQKAYSSIPDHYHSGLGSLSLIEVS